MSTDLVVIGLFVLIAIYYSVKTLLNNRGGLLWKLVSTAFLAIYLYNLVWLAKDWRFLVLFAVGVVAAAIKHFDIFRSLIRRHQRIASSTTKITDSKVKNLYEYKNIDYVETEDAYEITGEYPNFSYKISDTVVSLNSNFKTKWKLFEETFTQQADDYKYYFAIIPFAFILSAYYCFYHVAPSSIGDYAGVVVGTLMFTGGLTIIVYIPIGLLLHFPSSENIAETRRQLEGRFNSFAKEKNKEKAQKKIEELKATGKVKYEEKKQQEREAEERRIQNLESEAREEIKSTQKTNNDLDIELLKSAIDKLDKL